MNIILRKWGGQLLHSYQYAAAVALIASFLSFFDVPIGWLSTVIIALVTLQHGIKKGSLVSAWAILPAVALLYLGHYAVFVNIALHYIVILAFAWIYQRTRSGVAILQIASLIGVSAVVLIYFFAPELQHWLVNQITAMLKDYKNVSFLHFQSIDMNLWANYLNLFAIGLLVLATLLANILTLVIARWWQSFLVPQIDLQKECRAIRLHYSVSFSLALLTVGLFINSALFVNILLVAMIPFVLAGLSLLHAYLSNKKNGNMLLFFFYIVFLFLSPYLMMLLSLIGWLDSFLNFRKWFLVEKSVLEDNH